MSKTIQAVRGMNDLLPETTWVWQHVESIAREIFSQYGYGEVRLPIVEKTELSERSIGKVTDVVEKEMYTFIDRNGESLTLRPEGTAGAVRAGLEQGAFYNQVQRWWYQGPMFRHERPQKGRYRQFYQLGVEAIGLSGPDIDAEMIVMTARLWKKLGLLNRLSLEINTLGTPECRKAYRELLVAYFTQHANQLDEDSQRRLQTNPLRILDTKNPAMRDLVNAAPKLADHLDEASRQHFESLTSRLDAVGIAYVINPNLVRGLDYYAHTVFEWVSGDLGSQATVCGGGRYDGLIGQLGGQPTPAIGFAMGLERLILLLETLGLLPEVPLPTQVYFIVMGEAAERQGLVLAEQLRDALPHLHLMLHAGGGGMKNQFKRADKSGAQLALILGEAELAKQEVAIKSLREEKPQVLVPFAELANYLAQVFA